MIKVSTTGMAVSLKTDLRFPISGQWGHGDRIIQIFKMLSFADYGTNHKLTAARDVADPWYTGDFDATFDDVISGCWGLLEYIKEVYNL